MDVLCLDRGNEAAVARHKRILGLNGILHNVGGYLAMEVRVGGLVHVPLRPLLEGLGLDAPGPVVAELAALKIVAASGLQKSVGLLTHMYNLYRTSCRIFHQFECSDYLPSASSRLIFPPL